MEIAYVCRVIGYAFALKWFAFITIPDLLCLQNMCKNLPPGLCTKVLLLGTRNCFLICSFNAVNNHENTVSFFILNIQFISLQLWWAVALNMCTGTVEHSMCRGTMAHSMCTDTVAHSMCRCTVAHSMCTGTVADSMCTGTVTHSMCTGTVAHGMCTGTVAHSMCTSTVAHSMCRGTMAHSMCTGTVAHRMCTGTVAHGYREAPIAKRCFMQCFPL